jgi:crotonobetainyl-CoA:carnitine CoA-transferase CaiB-like acyl-CoA transferase
MSALTGTRIVELAESVAGEYCAKLLADFGAEVIKIERPDCGSPTRAMAPIIGDGGGPERSALFAYLNTNKRSVVLDVSSADEIETLHKIIATANAVVDDHAPSWSESVGLSASDVPRRHPAVVFCSITPYGAQAPPEFQNAKSINVFNSSGWGYHTPSHADPAKPPLKGPGRFLADYEAGLDAALCLAASLFWQLHSGRGQFIDVSQQAVLASRADSVLGRFITGEIAPQNTRDDYDQQGPASFFACTDGFVYLYMTSRNHWTGLKKLMGHPKWLDAFDDDWLEFSVTQEKVTTFQNGFAKWVADSHKDTVAEEAQRLGVPLVPVKSAADLKNSPQYRHRGFFQNVTHPVLGAAAYPGVPYPMTASPARITAAAPSLGQHTGEVMAGI